MVEVEDLFQKCDPIVKDLYTALLQKVWAFGPVRVEVKKSSLHVVNHAAFLGIHPKKGYLDINIVSETEIDDTRVVSVEQVSARRLHNRFRLTRITDINAALVSLLRRAYDFL
jgi:hypothetical protein